MSGKDLPTSSGSMAAEWAGLSPKRRQAAASLFLWFREMLPESKQENVCHMWATIAGFVGAASIAKPTGESLLVKVARSGSDPEGLAFIAHMDSIAREAVVEHLLPPGSRVWGCIDTLPAGCCGASRACDREVVADHLDACFRDQARSGQGWDGLQQEWLAAARHIEDAKDLWVWVDGSGEPREQEARQHLLAAATGLLNICSMVEAMGRGER